MNVEIDYARNLFHRYHWTVFLDGEKSAWGRAWTHRGVLRQVTAILELTAAADAVANPK